MYSILVYTCIRERPASPSYIYAFDFRTIYFSYQVNVKYRLRITPRSECVFMCSLHDELGTTIELIDSNRVNSELYVTISGQTYLVLSNCATAENVS